MTLIVTGVLAFVAIVVLIGMYNSLVQLRVRSESAWSDVDVQLKRRHDLIPNLVESVKGYATHEKSTFEDIARYRSMAMQADNPTDAARAEKPAHRGATRAAGGGGELSAIAGVGAVHRAAGLPQSIEDSLQNARRYTTRSSAISIRGFNRSR